MVRGVAAEYDESLKGVDGGGGTRVLVEAATIVASLLT
jgi:hypothetical protein